MKEAWNERYSNKDYIYGKEPNAFFKGWILNQKKVGSLLLPAEGEGRNAVFAAVEGWDVVAFDQSEQGREKALKFAREKGVEVDYLISDATKFITQKKFDVIAMIYTHFSVDIRKQIIINLISMLKPGGTLLIELFNKKQINNSSGGPKSVDMLYSEEELKAELSDMDINTQYLEEVEIKLDEGFLHKGKADVIRFIGIKPIN